MEVVANGERLNLKESTNVETLIEELNIKDRVMGVAINSKIVKKEEWSTTELQQDDKIEFLSFVGGG